MIRGVLLDLSGTLYLDAVPIPGAVEAVARLYESGLPLRFVTNTSRMSRLRLLAHLETLGFSIDQRDLFTAPMAMHRYLQDRNLRPHLLVHPDLQEEFDDLSHDDPNAVVVGFAREVFTYENLNAAFRLLQRGAPLLATGKTRYFADGDDLSLDAGPFITALEYAAETTATVLGKPSPEFFLSAVREMGLTPKDVVMIGDDAVSDVGAAMKTGLHGILVRTGKYQPGDEVAIGEQGDVAADATEAVELVLELG